MAACTSQSNFTHEVEEFEDYVGESDNKIKYNLCQKNPGHENFKSVYNLKMEDVPLAFQSDEWMNFFQGIGRHTVNLRTKFISYGREGLTWFGGEPYPYSEEIYKGNKKILRTGTGSIRRIEMYKNEPCRCKECKNSTHPVVGYMEISVETARHVVFDESESVHTTVELFYDTPDKNGVVLLDGCYSHLFEDSGLDDDRIVVVCVIHDKDMIAKLKSKTRFNNILNYINWNASKSGFTVSHPHGLHKQISFGQSLFSIFSIRKDHPEPEGFVRCRLKLPRINHNLPPDTSKMENKLLENGTSPSIVEPGVEYLLPDTSKMENKLENGTSPSMVEPGVEYLLPDTSKICVPGGQPFSHRFDDWMFDFSRSLGDMWFDWHDIPKGWRYKDSNGKFVPFPPGMEIFCGLERRSTVIYDIPTCPGSSGAYVYCVENMSYPECVHSGADEVWGNKGIYEALFSISSTV